MAEPTAGLSSGAIGSRGTPLLTGRFGLEASADALDAQPAAPSAKAVTDAMTRKLFVFMRISSPRPAIGGAVKGTMRGRLKAVKQNY